MQISINSVVNDEEHSITYMLKLIKMIYKKISLIKIKKIYLIVYAYIITYILYKIHKK